MSGARAWMRPRLAPGLWLWSVVLVLLVQLCVSEAEAAGVKTEVSARQVAVGQPFTVQISATQEEGQAQPSAPELKVKGGAEVQGPSISTQSMVRMHNFSFSSEKNVVARYQIVPKKKGRLTIGPGSFQVGNRRVRGEVIVVEVVSPDQLPSPRRRRSLFGSDPFDPFGNDPFDDFFRRHSRRPRIAPAPPEYQVEKARDPIAFLVTRLSRQTAVVGEPVVVTILGYGSQGDFAEAMPPTEPSLGDFLSYRALDNPQSEPPYQLEIGERTYVVRKLREYVLIPLKTGTLSIGSLKTVLQNNRHAYPARGSDRGLSVQSPPASLLVTQPPEKGRPDGYLLGDVGKYEMKVELSQREVVRGEFLELVVRIRGEGQIPTQVQLPEQNGVVWEAPSMEGGPEIQNGKLQGIRTIKYALQLTQEGTVDLGEVTLPVFDHQRRRYQTLRAALGSVEVKRPQQIKPVQPDTATDDAPKTLEVAVGRTKGVSFSPRWQALAYSKDGAVQFPAWAWWSMGGAPLLVYVGGALQGGLLRLARRRLQSGRGQAKQDLKLGAEALKKGDADGAMRLAERALFEALFLATGLRARGLMRHEVSEKLVSTGLREDLAASAQEHLKLLEACRYGSREHDPEKLFRAVSELVGSLPNKNKGAGT